MNLSGIVVCNVMQSLVHAVVHAVVNRKALYFSTNNNFVHPFNVTLVTEYQLSRCTVYG